MKRIKAVIFDMDGVMFDTERQAVDACCEVLADMGIRAGLRELTPAIGVSRSDSAAVYRGLFGSEFDYESFSERVMELQNERNEKNGVPVKPGLFELLQRLKAKGIKTAVASSTEKSRVQRLLELSGAGRYIDALMCGDMVTHSKPEPEIFLKAADLLGAEPGECAVLEDSPNGVLAAHRAGMNVIMVPDLIAPGENERARAAVVCSLERAGELIFPGLFEGKY